jgi:uncharacterized protein (DUF362 family)/Pyruvate/2-oxoacid:ferredoxin oxidoreductase delta subunit
MSNRVFLLSVDSYAGSPLQDAAKQIVGELSLDRAVTGKNVLIKPNLLVGAPPEKAITTHPEVVRAFIRALSSGHVTVGDSPALGSTKSVARATGVYDVCQAEGVEVVDFNSPQPATAPPNAICNSIPLASAVLQSDAVINIAKLKTHGLTRYTGAVKNLYGCLPGKLKAEMHVRMHEIDHFADLLLDIALTVNPLLSVVDGITAMEGNGPRSGTPRHVGVLIAGLDAVAVDTIACRVVGIEPDSVPTIRAARRRNIGCPEAEIEIVGNPLESVMVKGFKTIHGSDSALRNLPPFLQKVLREQLTARPAVAISSCTACGVCARACPVHAVKVTDKATIENKDCIRCYCCQELCPEGAISLRNKVLGRFLRN